MPDVLSELRDALIRDWSSRYDSNSHDYDVTQGAFDVLDAFAAAHHLVDADRVMARLEHAQMYTKGSTAPLVQLGTAIAIINEEARNGGTMPL